MTTKLEYKNGFVLYGEVVEKTDAGIWFKTKQETSFISYDLILSIKKLHGGY